MKQLNKLTMLLIAITMSTSMMAQNYALDFDGINDEVISSNIGTISGKTISAWVKLGNLTQGGGGLVTIEYDNGSVFDAIVYNETGQGWGFGSDGFQRTSWSGITETSTDWIHLAATYANNDYKLYRNGQLICTHTSDAVWSFPSNTRILIGKRHTGGGNACLNAVIDEVHVWNFVRTQTEIQTTMHNELIGTESGLVAYYKMSDGSGTSLTDNSTNSYTGTIFGATWVTLPQTPSLTTTAASDITGNTATSGGNASNSNWAFTNGVCWNTAGTPTLSDDFTTDGYGNGSFSSSLTGLYGSTLYYVRAYATSSTDGTFYGNEVSFTTSAVTNGDWQAQNITLYNTSEADIMVRAGDIDNLGFGWPNGFDPFSGNSTPPHAFPFWPEPEDVTGTDEIYRPSSYTGSPPHGQDGYCPHGVNPEAITLTYDLQGTVVVAATIQMFVDDFQAALFWANYKVTIDGVDAPFFANVINSLIQTGPIGKIITVQFPAAYIPLVSDGSLSILIDDETTGAGDGFAIDFAKLLINATGYTYTGTISGTVTDQGTGLPIENAVVTAGSVISDNTNASGQYTLNNVPAGLVYVEATKTGYTSSSTTVDLVSGASETVNFQLADATVTWDGSTSTDWNTASNWSGNAVPTSSNDVVIPNVANDPVIGATGTAICNNLTINSGALLTIQSNATGTGSLITNGTITNNGTVNIQRYITESAWHLISVPNNNTTANTFLGDYLQTWDETTATWSDITEPTTALTPVKGYGFWGTPAKATTYTFTGTPNAGVQNLAVTYTEVAGFDNDGANLLGNPYPSSIDWSGLDDTWGAVYYWNGTGYVTWNNGSGTGSQYIPPMQGFFIVTSQSGTFYLTNNDRTHNGAGNYYKSLNEITNGLVLEASNGSYNDELYIIFNEDASEGFDLQHDAYKFLSDTEGLSELYSFTDDKMLSIDVRPACETIQLGFQNDENGIYSIGIKEMADISEAILEDTKTGTFHNLQTGSYEFVWDVNDNEKRFILHLNAVGIEEGTAQQNETLIYASGKTIYIKNTESQENVQVRISDITGRIVLEKDIRSAELTSIPTNLKSGVYIVSLISGNKIETEKVFIK